jgi:hypothetical protein
MSKNALEMVDYYLRAWKYGRVSAMGSIEGEQYRWFIADDGSISMIPLSVLIEQGK